VVKSIINVCLAKFAEGNEELDIPCHPCHHCRRPLATMAAKRKETPCSTKTVLETKGSLWTSSNWGLRRKAMTAIKLCSTQSSQFLMCEVKCGAAALDIAGQQSGIWSTIRGNTTPTI
jgi:hypothetical protein